jgi:hypothetical protein
LKYFAKNARLFEEICKNLHFFDTHFNPLDITLALKFVSSQLFYCHLSEGMSSPGPFPGQGLGSTRRRRGGYQMSYLPHQRGSGWLSPG